MDTKTRNIKGIDGLPLGRILAEPEAQREQAEKARQEAEEAERARAQELERARLAAEKAREEAEKARRAADRRWLDDFVSKWEFRNIRSLLGLLLTVNLTAGLLLDHQDWISFLLQSFMALLFYELGRNSLSGRTWLDTVRRGVGAK